MTTLHDKSDTFICLHIKLLYWNGQDLPAWLIFTTTPFLLHCMTTSMQYRNGAFYCSRFSFQNLNLVLVLQWRNICCLFICCNGGWMLEVYHSFFWMKASSSHCHCITKYYFRQSKELHLSLNCFWVDLWLVFVTLDVILWHDRTPAAALALSLLYIYV